VLDFPLEELPAFILPERLRRLASPDQSITKTTSKWTWVEEVDDKEVGGCRRWAQEFDGAVEELGEGKTLFEEIHERQEATCEPPMAPYVDEDKWDLVR